MGGLGTRMQQGTIDTGLSGGFWLVNNENPSSADGRWITSHGLTTQFDQIAELTQLQADAAFSDGSGPSDTALNTARQLLIVFATQFPAPPYVMLLFDIVSVQLPRN